MRLEKGCYFAVDGCYYVLVYPYYSFKTKALKLFCICDNANNIYSWDLDDIRPPAVLRDRKVPFDVIVEVLRGQHDHRFDHWVRAEDLHSGFDDRCS